MPWKWLTIDAVDLCYSLDVVDQIDLCSLDFSDYVSILVKCLGVATGLKLQLQRLYEYGSI